MSWRPSPALRDGALWSTAAVAVLAAHLGGALWVLQKAEAAAPPGLPEPIYVELAPAPMADAPQDITEAEEMEEIAPEPEPEPEIAMPEPEEIEPLPDMETHEPPPEDAVVLNKSERPKERPEPSEEKKIVEKPREKKPEPERKKERREEQPASRKTTQVSAPKGDRSGAPLTQAGQPSKRQIASWQSKLNSAVARHMKRTRVSGRNSVTVTIAFTLSGNGQVSGARMLSTTGNPKDDAALNRQIARMPRLPAPPDGKSVPLTLPVRIK